MKNFYLIFISLLLIVTKVKCQQTPETAIVVNAFYGGQTATINASSYGLATPGINYGCLTTGRYAWIIVPVCGISSFMLNYSTYVFDTAGYSVYGPFQDTTGITSQLSLVSPIICDGYNGNSNPGHIWVSTQLKGLYYIALTFKNDTLNRTVYSTAGSMAAICTYCNNANLMDQSICLISLDSATNRNKIIFDKGDTSNIAGYTIYRENSITNQYDSLTYINRDSSNYFIDMTANPNSRYWRYKMLRNDKCGNNISSISFNNYVIKSTTIFLQQGISTNNSINLSWNYSSNIQPSPGSGPWIQSFYIYRSDGTNPFQAIDSIPINSGSYTDLNPSPGLNLYKVTMRKTSFCNIVRTSYAESSSNIISTTFTGLNEPVNHHYFDVYPNPASSEVTIEIAKGASSWKLSLYAVDGRIVLRKEGNSSGKNVVNIAELSKGFYTIKLSSGEKDFYKQLLIQ